MKFQVLLIAFFACLQTQQDVQALSIGRPIQHPSSSVARSLLSYQRHARSSLFRTNVPDRLDRSTIESSRSRLFQAYDDGDLDEAPPPLLAETSLTLRRISWFSWWSQVILTTISAVILTFARNVVGKHSASAMDGPNFVLSGLGVLISGASIVWTWGNGARLSRRLWRRPATPIQAAKMLRRAIRVGVSLNLLGLLVNLLAAEEIVGSLAIKVLTTSGRLVGTTWGSTLEGLQPLDILVVQANTNSLLSHFCSLVSLLYLTGQVEKLDPPSTEVHARS